MKHSGEDVALVVPVYNEATVIRQVASAARGQFPYVICVNDGSTDNSALEIEKSGAILVNHPINMGQGAALQTGIDFALQNPLIRYIVTYDADGQHRLEDVTSMLKTIKSGDFDIVLGSRFLGSAQNISTTKKLVLKMAIKFSNATSGIKLTDTHNGLRIMTRKTAELMCLQSSDYAHASEIIERIAEKKLKYCEVPVTIVYTDYSRSKGQSLLNSINIASDTLMSKVFK